MADHQLSGICSSTFSAVKTPGVGGLQKGKAYSSCRCCCFVNVERSNPDEKNYLVEKQQIKVISGESLGLRAHHPELISSHFLNLPGGTQTWIYLLALPQAHCQTRRLISSWEHELTGQNGHTPEGTTVVEIRSQTTMIILTHTEKLQDVANTYLR